MSVTRRATGCSSIHAGWVWDDRRSRCPSLRGRLDAMRPTSDEVQRRIAHAAARSALLDKHGNRCQSCGVDNAPLEVALIVPIVTGGGYETDNLALLCRNCHYLLDRFRPSGLEFERFLLDILAASPDYVDVVPGSRLRTPAGLQLQVDLTATRAVNGKRERVLIEAKAWPSLGRAQVQGAIEQIERYRGAGSFDAAALAFPGRLGEGDKASLEAAAIEVWDLDHVAVGFANEIAAQPPFRPPAALLARSPFRWARRIGFTDRAPQGLHARNGLGRVPEGDRRRVRVLVHTAADASHLGVI